MGGARAQPLRRTATAWRSTGLGEGPRVASGEPLVVACTVDGRVGLAAAGRRGFGPQARPAHGGDRGRSPLALRGTNGRLLFAWVGGDNHVHLRALGTSPISQGTEEIESLLNLVSLVSRREQRLPELNHQRLERKLTVRSVGHQQAHGVRHGKLMHPSTLLLRSV